MLELFLLTFHSGEPIWKETSMQVTEKETEFGLGRETEKVCGFRESRKGYLIQERPSTMVRTTASHRQMDKCLWFRWECSRRKQDKGLWGHTHYSALSALCPFWQDSRWTNRADVRTDQAKKIVKVFFDICSNSLVSTYNTC